MEYRCEAYRNDMVSNLYVGDALANALDNTTTLVTKNDRESSLRILTCSGCQ